MRPWIQLHLRSALLGRDSFVSIEPVGNFPLRCFSFDLLIILLAWLLLLLVHNTGVPRKDHWLSRPTGAISGSTLVVELYRHTVMFLTFQSAQGHYPTPWRVNTVFSNLPQFAEAFGCPSQSPLNPEQRCSLWWCWNSPVFLSIKQHTLSTKCEAIVAIYLGSYCEVSWITELWDEQGCWDQTKLELRSQLKVQLEELVRLMKLQTLISKKNIRNADQLM